MPYKGWYAMKPNLSIFHCLTPRFRTLHRSFIKSIQSNPTAIYSVTKTFISLTISLILLLCSCTKNGIFCCAVFCLFVFVYVCLFFLFLLFCLFVCLFFFVFFCCFVLFLFLFCFFLVFYFRKFHFSRLAINHQFNQTFLLSLFVAW